MRFKFEAYGSELMVEAKNQVEAFDKANEALLWPHPNHNGQDGMWNYQGEMTYRWVTGNFFD